MELHNVFCSGNAAIRPYSVTTMSPPRDRTFSFACGFEAWTFSLYIPHFTSSCLFVVISFSNSPSPVIVVVLLFNTITDHKTTFKCKKIPKRFYWLWRMQITCNAWESVKDLDKEKKKESAFYSSNKNDETYEMTTLIIYVHAHKILEKGASNNFSVIIIVFCSVFFFCKKVFCSVDIRF